MCGLSDPLGYGADKDLWGYITEKNISTMLRFSVFPKRLGRVISVTSSPLSHHDKLRFIDIKIIICD